MKIDSIVVSVKRCKKCVRNAGGESCVGSIILNDVNVKIENDFLVFDEIEEIPLCDIQCVKINDKLVHQLIKK